MNSEVILSLLSLCVVSSSACPSCDAVADVLFIVDTSTSPLGGPVDGPTPVFGQAKDFLIDVFNGLSLGSNRVMTSLVHYSGSPTVDYNFSSPASTDISEIEDAINGLPNPQGASDIHEALTGALNTVWPNPMSRSHACNVTVFVTNGENEQPAETTAALNNYRAQTNSRFCVVEFRDPSEENESQKANRDRTLQELKGADGLTIGADLFNSKLAVGYTISCICNACSWDCRE